MTLKTVLTPIQTRMRIKYPLDVTEVINIGALNQRTRIAFSEGLTRYIFPASSYIWCVSQESVSHQAFTASSILKSGASRKNIQIKSQYWRWRMGWLCDIADTHSWKREWDSGLAMKSLCGENNYLKRDRWNITIITVWRSIIFVQKHGIHDDTLLNASSLWSLPDCLHAWHTRYSLGLSRSIPQYLLFQESLTRANAHGPEHAHKHTMRMQRQHGQIFSIKCHAERHESEGTLACATCSMMSFLCTASTWCRRRNSFILPV